MLLVVFLVMVLVLAVGLPVKQACDRRKWLATAMADAQAQSSFADPDSGGGAATTGEGRGQELSLFRVSRLRDSGSGVGLPDSGLMEALDESSARGGGGSLAMEPESQTVEDGEKLLTPAVQLIEHGERRGLWGRGRQEG